MEEQSNNSAVAAAANSVSQDAKNMALLVWIGSIFFGFIPSLIMYLVKKDDAYIEDQSKEALNWCITATIGCCRLDFDGHSYRRLGAGGSWHLPFGVLHHGGGSSL